MLLTLAAPLSDRPISEISPAEVFSVLRTVEKSGRRETAHLPQCTKLMQDWADMLDEFRQLQRMNAASAG